jgi:chromosome condensin MukBEF ATPase and DNA-binding subunit MukB
MLARDQVMAFFQEAAKQAMAAGEMVPQIAPDLIESTVAQQTSQIMREIMPMLQPAQQQDPLVAIRQQELENSQMEVQRKMANDQMDFQIDQAKLQQAYELAQQRQALQSDIAEARNDVNVYRINTQAALSRNK